VTAGETPTLSDKAAGMAPQSYLTQQCHMFSHHLCRCQGPRLAQGCLRAGRVGPWV
jgi:hypothetical protein